MIIFSIYRRTTPMIPISILLPLFGGSFKKKLASNRLGREASWFETVEEYKGILKDILAKKKINPKPMNDLKDYYEDLNS